MISRILCCFLAFAFCLIGQTDSQPIQMSGIRDGSLMLTNRTSKKIVGYVLKLEQVDSRGNVVQKLTDSRLTGLEPAPSRDAYAPGETWRHRLRVAAHRMSVEFVLFADRSTWGENSLGYSEKFKGIEEGWRTAHARLKRILTEKGPAAVGDELRRF